MPKILSFFRLIRWINLIFIALTQILLQYLFLGPILSNPFVAIDASLNTSQFFLLVLSTLLIAAGGYMINDYFDVKADEINKPHRIFVDRVFSRRSIIIGHLIFNFIGIGLGFYLANAIGNWKLGFIHFGTMAVLWLYSTQFKKWPLVGNLLVSMMTALVILIVFWFEPKLSGELKERMPEVFDHLYFFFWGYAGFAFLVTLIRELVKDMEDITGDQQDGGFTLPIVWGIKKTKQLVTFLIVMTILMLLFFQVEETKSYMEQNGFSFENGISFQEITAIIKEKGLFFLSIPSIRIVFTFLQIPLVYLIILVLKADRPAQFKTASTVTKIIMLFGILFIFYFYSLNGNPSEDLQNLFN